MNTTEVGNTFVVGAVGRCVQANLQKDNSTPFY